MEAESAREFSFTLNKSHKTQKHVQMIHSVICHRIISAEPAGMSRIIINSRNPAPKFKFCSVFSANYPTVNDASGVTMMPLRSCSRGGDDFWCGVPPRLNECSGNTEMNGVGR